MGEIDILKTFKRTVKGAGDAVPYLLGCILMPLFGREARKFWVDGLELDAWDHGSSSRSSMASLRFFPEHEQRAARGRVNNALVSYQRRHTKPS